jgi:hypothetical protein
MPLPRLLAVLLATYSALCFGQNAARYTVTGTVVNFATGEPIRRALVAVGGALVFTGADGRFQAENIPEGQTMVAAQKPGYFDCANIECGGVTARAQTIVMVHSGTNDVLLKLVPEAAIQGRIVDEDGDPIGNVQVTAMSERISNGRKQLIQLGSANADESGIYRMERLMPGNYTIGTLPRAAFLFLANISDNIQPQMYPRQFYPNGSDSSGAQTIELKPGQVVDADFKLASVPAFHIAGSIAPATGGISVAAEDSQGQEMPLQLQLRSTSGKFIVPFIPAGTWNLHFIEQTQGQQYYADATVTISSRNIDNLQIAMQPLASVPVNIENGLSENGANAQVQLVSRDTNGANYGGNPEVSPYLIGNVRPGRYAVLISAANQCVDSVSSGNVDLTQDDLVIAPGSQPRPINISLRKDCASLEVSVRSEDQAAKSTILLLPSSHAMAPVTVQAEPGASAKLNNLSPGEYRVYAFSNIQSLEYASPEVMRQFAGQEITLTANQHATVTLDVIARGDK